MTAQGRVMRSPSRGAVEPQIFGHTGIDTVMGVADPVTGVALMFNTTNGLTHRELGSNATTGVAVASMEPFLGTAASRLWHRQARSLSPGCEHVGDSTYR